MTEYRGQGTADASTATTTSILRETATATASQTVFNLSTINYTPGTNEIGVFVDGVKQLLTTDYTETSNTIITFVSGLTGGEVVEFEAILGGQLINTTDATKAVFTHSAAGSEQTTVAEALDALALDVATDLKTVDGAEVQRAITRGAITANDGGGGIYYWDKDSTATDTSGTTGSVVQQNGVTTGRWLRLTTNTFSGNVTMDDDLVVDGTTESTSTTTGSIQTDGGLGVAKNASIGQDLVFDEQADHSSTPAAGKGYLWVKSDIPSTLQFTDDTGADTDISAAGGTVTVASDTTDTTTFPLFSNTETGSISAKSNPNLTFNAATANLSSTTFTGALSGNATTATTAGTVTTAAQPNITSLGTLTILDVDNVQINGSTVTTTTGGLTIDSTSGTTTVDDDLTVTGNITSTGIDDNATGERLEVTDIALELGDSSSGEVFSIHLNTTTDGTLSLSGGPAGSTGANINLRGVSHAGNPGDLEMNSSGNRFFFWDESAGAFTVNTGTGAKTQAFQLDASQNATFAGKVLASGDTAAGDDAAMGYTATEGLILTGQGSSNDVTIKNDADQNVMTVPTGTLNAVFEGTITVDSLVQPKVKIVDIGDWNMDTTGSVNIAHGLTTANIRCISVLIRNDTGTYALPIDWTDSTTDNLSGYWELNGSNVVLTRFTSGTFDDVTYNSTSFNRGWITIHYV